MGESSSEIQKGQGLAYLSGIIFLVVGIYNAWASLLQGWLHFTVRHTVSTGSIAGLQIAACIVVGIYLIISARRRIKKIAHEV